MEFKCLKMSLHLNFIGNLVVLILGRLSLSLGFEGLAPAPSRFLYCWWEAWCHFNTRSFVRDLLFSFFNIHWCGSFWNYYYSLGSELDGQSISIVLQAWKLFHIFYMKLVENVNRTKWLDFPISKRELFPAFGLQLKHPLFPSPELTSLWLGTPPLVFPVLRSSDSPWNYTIGSFGFPVS